MAILSIPQSSTDRITNDAILETAFSHTNSKLSIVLRASDHTPSCSLPELRRHVSEIYSMAWDCADGWDSSSTTSKIKLLDVIVYPQNLPNAAPEKWLNHRKDLDGICSSAMKDIVGWSSDMGWGGRGGGFKDVLGEGEGGLEEHVEALNVDRRGRGLGDVKALAVHVVGLEGMAETNDDNVVFLEDDEQTQAGAQAGAGAGAGHNRDMKNKGSLIGGTSLPPKSLYTSVAVGGTFDGMHYGHRKLLTLAVSSVDPTCGKLLVGVTTDDMLTSKSYSEYIPDLRTRLDGVRTFLNHLAPGLKNRMRIVPISDAYGPPGMQNGSVEEVTLPDGTMVSVKNDFDALVLSHETLPNGRKLNDFRVDSLGLKPLALLCTRRTESHGMSSTALRRMRSKNMLDS